MLLNPGYAASLTVPRPGADERRRHECCVERRRFVSHARLECVDIDGFGTRHTGAYHQRKHRARDLCYLSIDSRVWASFYPGAQQHGRGAKAGALEDPTQVQTGAHANPTRGECPPKPLNGSLEKRTPRFRRGTLHVKLLEGEHAAVCHQRPEVAEHGGWIREVHQNEAPDDRVDALRERQPCDVAHDELHV